MSSKIARVAHVVFVWSPSGYRVDERDGDAPDVGSVVEEDGVRFLVTKVGPSPLPGDTRPCAYLQPAP